jgi:hypothetical protein
VEGGVNPHLNAPQPEPAQDFGRNGECIGYIALEPKATWLYIRYHETVLENFTHLFAHLVDSYCAICVSEFLAD